MILAIQISIFDDETQTELSSTLEIEKNGVYIKADGYCNFYGEKNGQVAKIEYYNQDLRVICWSDINREDETDSISLEYAKLSNRVED